MFFRRKPVTLQSLDERLSVIELALEIRREQSPIAHQTRGGPLDVALAKLQRAMHRETDRRRA